MIVTTLLIINPSIAAERARLLQTSGMKAFIQMLSPQKFQPLSNNQILFVEKVNRNHTEAQGLFIAKRNPELSATWKWQIISANKLHLEKQKNKEEHLLMQGGKIYNLSSSGSKAQLGSFETGNFKIPEAIFNPRNDLRAIPLLTIWKQRNSNALYQAELQWRASSILMIFVLSFVAVSISPVNPRSGRFAKIFPAVIIFLIYVAILFKWREHVASDLWPGSNMFWVHGLIFLIGAFLFWRQKSLNVS
jgi:lipopolysaccharide export system permease protein